MTDQSIRHRVTTFTIILTVALCATFPFKARAEFSTATIVIGVAIGVSLAEFRNHHLKKRDESAKEAVRNEAEKEEIKQ